MIDNPNAIQLCGAFVQGQTASYPCALPLGHEGTAEGLHVAVEVPSSQLKFEQWKASRITALAAFPEQAKQDGSILNPDGKVPVLDDSMLTSPEEREAASLARMASRSISELPPYLSNILVFESAMTSLAILWALCQSEFARGARGVVVTPEFLSRLATPSVRNLMESLRVDPNEQTKEHGPS